MPTKMQYCAKCGNSGYLLDGSPCGCRAVAAELYSGVECLDIPEAYRGLKFSADMLPPRMGDAYKNTLKNFYEQITSLRLKCHNLLICSPMQTGKSIFAYSAMQELFRMDIDVFPMFDILEIKRIMIDIEYNRAQSLGVDSPLKLFTAPYVFAYIPPMTTYDVYDTAAMLIARRVRRGNSTILLYGGTWNQLILNDNKGSLKNMKGNGSLTTIDVSSWEEKE